MKVVIPITRKVLFEKFNIELQKEDILLSILDGCEIKMDIPAKTVGSEFIYYYKNKVLLFEENTLSKTFKANYECVWKILLEDYNMSTRKIMELIFETYKNILKLEENKYRIGAMPIKLNFK